jgi:hypothetical protein
MAQSVALGYGLDDRGSRVRFPAGLKIFPFTIASRTVLEPTQPSIQWVPWALSLGVKLPEREADHLPPSSAEVKEWVELYLHSPIPLHSVVFSQKKKKKEAQGQLWLISRDIYCGYENADVNTTVQFLSNQSQTSLFVSNRLWFRQRNRALSVRNILYIRFSHLTNNVFFNRIKTKQRSFGRRF